MEICSRSAPSARRVTGLRPSGARGGVRRRSYQSQVLARGNEGKLVWGLAASASVAAAVGVCGPMSRPGASDTSAFGSYVNNRFGERGWVRSKKHRLRSQSHAVADVGGGGGGGGGGKDDNGLRTGDAGDGGGDAEDGEDTASAAAAALAAQKLTTGALPMDMQVALAKGALSPADIAKFAKVIQMPVLGKFARKWRPLRERLMGSDRLLFTLLAEEAIGLTAKTSAELKARKDMFWKEIDFVISDLALEVGVRVFSFTWSRSRRLVHFFAARARIPLLCALSA